MPSSTPGTSGSVGVPPTAMRMFLPVYVLSPTATVLGPTNLASPTMSSTSEFARLFL